MYWVNNPTHSTLSNSSYAWRLLLAAATVPPNRTADRTYIMGGTYWGGFGAILCCESHIYSLKRFNIPHTPHIQLQSRILTCLHMIGTSIGLERTPSMPGSLPCHLNLFYADILIWPLALLVGLCVLHKSMRSCPHLSAMMSSFLQVHRHDVGTSKNLFSIQYNCEA